MQESETTITAAGPSNLLHPCVQCVGGELSVDVENLQQKSNFENFDVLSSVSESD